MPAVYSYDPATDEYVVHEYGERHRYESKSALEGDWSRIKRPFVPVELLPNPEYDERHYAIVILVEGEESSRVYRNGETEAISTLLETAFSLDQSGVTEANETTSLKHPDESETTQEASVPTDDAGESEQNPEQPSAEASQQWKDDPNKAVGRFVAEHISEAADGSATSATVYATYEAWAENHGLEPDAKNWFSRRLSNHVEFERTVEYRNASSIRCYEGIELREDETI